MLYTSPLSRLVHSGTNLTSLGSILAMQQLHSKSYSHIAIAVYNQVFIYTTKWTEASWRERKCPNFETVSKGGFEPRLSRLRVRRSTTELPCSTKHDSFIGRGIKLSLKQSRLSNQQTLKQNKKLSLHNYII